MKENPCLSIQEEIAWSRTLSPDSQSHVLACAECTKISLEFSKLDSAYSESDVEVPKEFTNRVMLAIQKESTTSSRQEWLKNFVAKLGGFFQLRPVQVTVALWIAFSMSRAF